jgi:predicted lysophospholipase L1 biosynthesis ABC-type transport system permease subunit
LGVPLISGRTFTREEAESEAPLAIVSEAAAARYWPGKSPLGRKIVADKHWARRVAGHLEYTVIGVSKTVRSTFLSKEDSGFIYMPRAVQDSSAVLLVRTRSTPAHAFKVFTAILSGVDANLPSRTYMIGMEQGPMRLQSLMSQAPAVAASVLGGLALLLACLGIFGVVSRLVAMRTREIGLRLVLGATKKHVVRLIARETFRPVAWGAAVGMAGALAASSLLNSLVAIPTAPDLTYGAGAFDPVTFVSVFLVLALTATLAGAGPVRHATLVEPAIALRDE